MEKRIFEKGDLLTAKRTLKMDIPKGRVAIIKGEDYEWNYLFGNMIAVKTLISDDHYFDLDKKSESSWTKYFRLKKAPMQIESIEHGEIELVVLRSNNGGGRLTPHCEKHGAMNKITKDGFWRCLTVTGYKPVNNGNAKGGTHVETICRAGCKEVNSNEIKS